MAVSMAAQCGSTLVNANLNDRVFATHNVQPIRTAQSATSRLWTPSGASLDLSASSCGLFSQKLSTASLTLGPSAIARSRPCCARASAASSSGSATYEQTSSSSSASAASLAQMERTAATLYDLLGLPRRDVSLAEIKGAYRSLARRYHPDSRPAELTLEECTRRFIEVQEAYEILSDPQRRAMYDFEMLHPASAKSGLGRREAGWRRGNAQPWAAQAGWQSPEEQAEARAAWRAQWEGELSGLRNRGRAQAKPGSWAARMRQQQEEEQQGAAAAM